MFKPLLLFASPIVFFGLSAPGTAASECLNAPSTSELQSVSDCAEALCCPRALRLQINVVRKVASKLHELEYDVKVARKPKECAETETPAVTGYYNPNYKKYEPMRIAIERYKIKNKIEPIDGEITYEFVESLLGVDLLQRWRTE